ncbi:PseG/SpsG family protein [Alkaliphilus hydrothermalis]|uniref:Spore coat polysaccharide biosynthesis predicted glycosyltransferase SpsG n=1 Tax=Alkaliphilus hydrothermalis TaxID=1482730 RepID=A0ABS2NRD1_9FIRM|nr:hypothetical protein [Alkaliphilus hydrothermalis]MBM7615381.1 spore coat polysaccharide biosynthesis predicted glycosyltransferase SpsG [Alkaliphilus hydrothermalis]
MKLITFRTMGGAGIGYGHYFRCISLAEAFLRLNSEIKIVFIVNRGLEAIIRNTGHQTILEDSFDGDLLILEELKPDLIVFDSYLANDDYLKSLSQVSKLAIFDDNDDIYDSAIPDAIINGNIHGVELEYSKRKDGIYLLGTDYLIMKPEYWESMRASNVEVQREEKTNKRLKQSHDYKIMITTGGSDTHKLSLQILKELLNTDYTKMIIIGPSYSKELIEELEDLAKRHMNIVLIYKPSSLKKYIIVSDVVITAGGSTVYEILSQKKIPIVFSWADNQDLICRKLKDKGIPFIGKYPHINFNSIVMEINRISHSPYVGVSIDGQGAQRVAETLVRIL